MEVKWLTVINVERIHLDELHTYYSKPFYLPKINTCNSNTKLRVLSVSSTTSFHTTAFLSFLLLRYFHPLRKFFSTSHFTKYTLQLVLHWFLPKFCPCSTLKHRPYWLVVSVAMITDIIWSLNPLWYMAVFHSKFWTAIIHTYSCI